MNLFIENKDRAILTFKTAMIVGTVVHLFLIVNSFQNIDSMWGTYYSKYDSSTMGRFTLSWVSSLSSWFDLQYFNSILSILFMAITVIILIEIFGIKNKILIFLFVTIYVSFPSVSGTLTYSFLTDAYFLATMLVVLSVLLIKKLNDIPGVIISIILIYISIGVYQTNLAYILTLYFILIIKDSIKMSIDIKFYIKGLISVVLGLLAYIIHYKAYEFKFGLTDYQGINSAGDISIASLIEATKISWITFSDYFFGGFKFENTFEILNIIYIIALFLIFLYIFIVNKIQIKYILIVLFSLTLIPFLCFLMYFISPGIFYHNLMFHHMVFIYVIGIIVIEIPLKSSINIIKNFNKIVIFVLFIIAFNLIIITNIYYEKLETTNNQIYSMATQISYEIKKLDGYNESLPLILIGDPANSLPLNLLYDEKTPPLSPGTSKHIINSTSKFVRYLEQFVALKNPVSINEQELLNLKAKDIERMNTWPLNDSIKIINEEIIIKFP